MTMYRKDPEILRALDRIDPNELSYTEWIKIGMALKNEGFECSDWENWSRKDIRFKEGECAYKWKGFNAIRKKITKRSLFWYARQFGYEASQQFEDEYPDLVFAEPPSLPPPPEGDWQPAEQLIAYLETLFRPDEYICYVTNEVWFDRSADRWKPRTGVCSRTAGEIIEALKKYPDDISSAVGTCQEAYGAAVRANPLDGNGGSDSNVTDFRYALVESDTLDLNEQYKKLISLEIPIATIVHSGNKSLHALVRVDAKDRDEYRERVDLLYNYLQENGFDLDPQNKNPSRLTRMPGVTRNGKKQYLVALNTGKAGWDDWIRTVPVPEGKLPEPVSLADYRDGPPPLKPELIEGILRCGHKMIIGGPSKAGKSFLLDQLCIALAEGLTWMGFKCRQGKVMYINFEIDENSCINRFFNIFGALGIPQKHPENVTIWNLRGYSKPLDELYPEIIKRTKDRNYEAIILDPLYKIGMGDENSAAEVGKLCNYIDKICEAADCAFIYCHHHSKGAQGQKKSMDRTSGSGVFARDPDAILDIIELELDENRFPYSERAGVSAWRLETTLREFQGTPPIDFWFKYPLHVRDTEGRLKEAFPNGSPEANLAKSPKRTSIDEMFNAVANPIDFNGGKCSIQDIMDYAGVSNKTAYNYVNKFPDAFILNDGFVSRRIA